MFNNNQEPNIYKEQVPTVEEEKKKDNKMVIIGVILAVAIVAAVLVFNIMSGNLFGKAYAPKTTTHPGFVTSTSSTTTTSTSLITTTTTDFVPLTSSTTSTTTTKKTTRKTTFPTTLKKTDREIVLGKITSNIDDMIFKLKISNLDLKQDAYYELMPDKVVKIKTTSFRDGIFQFEMYYNEKKIVTEKLSKKNDLEVYLMGDAFIYINTDSGSPNYHHIFIKKEIGGNVKNIYEMESVKGMVPKRIEFTKDKMIVYTSRIKGTSIEYGTLSGADYCDPSTWMLGLTKSTIVESTYTYNLMGSTFNVKPIHSNPVTLGTYIAQNEMNC